MKLILENWRKYLAEELVKFSGILKLMPDEDTISELRTISVNLPPDAVSLPEDKWHVTLAHQSGLKSYRKQLKPIDKAGEMPSGPQVILLPEVEERTDDALDRKSWVVWLENQDEMKDYVNQIMEMVGGPLDPEPN